MDNLNAQETKKTELLVQVARLYYEHDLSQNEIAKRVNLSRSYVSKLLTEARNSGIVEIKIHDPGAGESRMERKLREYYDLKQVIIFPNGVQANWLHQAGKVVAGYLNSILEDGFTIGFTWGETVYQCVKSLPKREDLSDITTLQLCGGISNTKKNVYVNEITQLLTQALNGTGYILPFPAIVSSKELKNVLMNEPAMQEVMSRVSSLDVILMTMTNLSPQCALARAGYLREDEMKNLLSNGAIGDICTHIINAKGEICDQELDNRTIAVPLKDLKRIKTRIGAAVGENKLESTIAALEGGIINVLVTNEKMVEMIRNVKPEIFE